MKPRTLVNLTIGALAVPENLVEHARVHLRDAGMWTEGGSDRGPVVATTRMAATLVAALLSTDRQTEMPSGVRKFAQMRHAPHLGRGDVPHSFGDVEAMSAFDFILHALSADRFRDPTCEAGFYLEYDRLQKRLVAYFGESIARPNLCVWQELSVAPRSDDRGLRIRLGIAGRDLRAISRAFALEREQGRSWEDISREMSEAA